MSHQRTSLAAFVALAMFASSAATAAPRTVDPLIAVSIMGSSESRAAACSGPAGASLCGAASPAAAAAGAAVVAQGADQSEYSGSSFGDMWPLWLGLTAVAAFWIWTFVDDDDDDDEIVEPVSP